MSAMRKPAPKAEPVENVVILPAGLIELCAAKGDIRYYLNWPYLDLSDKKQPMLVATNGHVLAAAPVVIEGTVAQGPLPIKAIAAARAAKRPNPDVGARLIFVGDMCGTADVMYRRPNGDFKYPDWRKVVPELAKDATPDIGINGDYMAILQRAVCGKSTRHPGLEFYCQRDGKQIAKDKSLMVRSTVIGENDGAFGVVMPIKL